MEQENTCTEVLRDYAVHMMERRASSWRLADSEEAEGGASSVRDRGSEAAIDLTVSVRKAKAHLSALLEEVALGRVVTITSDGRPKARLVPIDASRERAPFRGTREHLADMPAWTGAAAQEIIREDRDGRGW